MAASLLRRGAGRFVASAVVVGSFGLFGWGALAAGCDSPSERLPPRPMIGGSDGGGGFQGGTGGGPPDPDAGGYCGNELHEAVLAAPNLYFVVDASGSMGTLEAGETRYHAVRVAIVDLARNLGPLVKVGAALLPRHGAGADSCEAGEEVFPVQQGDPITGVDGPTTIGLWQSLGTVPEGGTPISATLEALRPTLEALEGETHVVIATDGGPNCNGAATCGAEACMLNIDGECDDPSVNCCAPDLGGPTFCVDQPATVSAIAALAVSGIGVHVVGIPGSETYADVLDAMAIAGGSTKQASPFYDAVGELGALGGVLAEIAKLAVTCEFELVDPPSEVGMTNVYLDEQILPYNDPDGWVWKPPWTVRLLGEACDRLKSGKVAKVQIVSGCPTEEPK
jgi:hypothetical protein